MKHSTKHSTQTQKDQDPTPESLEQEIRELRRELQEEREHRVNFIATLTHDLRSPLTSARLNAELTLRKLEDPVLIKKYTTKVITGLSRVDQMIQNLLDANLITAGQKISMKRESLELTALLSATVTDLNAVHGQRFVLTLGQSEIIGQWCADGIRRVVENLCTNAVKYGGSETPITIAVSKKNDLVTIAVHNFGNPLPAAELPHLFTAFHRVPGARENHQNGWGLGLTLVRGMVESHGGTVQVTSSAEAGTTFTVELPLS